MAESNSPETSSLESRKSEPETESGTPGLGGSRPPVGESAEPELAGAARLKGLDADIEKELEEAMGGLSEKEIYAAPAASPPATAGDAGTEGKRKKGRVLAIHGPDVFVDVPGGRSQGVLPASQFPDGPPAVGSEIEFHIEGYDNENGLLLLSRQGAAQTADWSSVAVGMIVE